MSDLPEDNIPESDANPDAKLGVERSEGHMRGITRNVNVEAEEAAKKFAIEVARLLQDDKCTEVLVLDLRGRSQMTDFFVVASGTSDRQMRASGMHVEELGEEHGFTLQRHNLRENEPTWIVLDFVDIVVHLFEPQTRLYYDIEMLWGDAERVAWQRGS